MNYTEVLRISEMEKGYEFMEPLMRKISNATDIPMEFVTGDITAHHHLTLELKNGQQLIFACGDCDDSTHITVKTP
jgi:hypothetical protein